MVCEYVHEQSHWIKAIEKSPKSNVNLGSKMVGETEAAKFHIKSPLEIVATSSRNYPKL